MARYMGENVVDTDVGIAQGAARVMTDASGLMQPMRQAAGAWQDWKSHALQPGSAQPLQQEAATMMDDSSRAAADARRNARTDAASAVCAESRDSLPVATGKRTVMKETVMNETRRQLPRSEAVEDGFLPAAYAVLIMNLQIKIYLLL